MNRLTVIAATVISTLAVTAGAAAWWFKASYVAVSADEDVLVIKRIGSMPNLYSTSDGLIVLNGKQTVECATGGGCAIYSERELKRAIMHILLTLQQGQKPDA